MIVTETDRTMPRSPRGCGPTFNGRIHVQCEVADCGATCAHANTIGSASDSDCNYATARARFEFGWSQRIEGRLLGTYCPAHTLAVGS